MNFSKIKKPQTLTSLGFFISLIHYEVKLNNLKGLRFYFVLTEKCSQPKILKKPIDYQAVLLLKRCVYFAKNITI